DCSGTPAFVSTVTVNGNGAYTSGVATPGAAGVYRWVASFSGDESNAPARTACGDETETVEITQAQPTLTTLASDSITLGGEVFDQALLDGAADPTGTITFKLYGPGDSDCSGDPVFTSTVKVSSTGPYQSDSFRPTKTGIYRWVAAYSGDRDNKAASTR